MDDGTKKNKKITRRKFVEATTLGVTGGLILSNASGCASGTVLVGEGNRISTIPRGEWEQGQSDAPQAVAAELRFMSDEHHLVRNLVVKELPNVGKPLTPQLIAQMSNLPVARVNVILDDLEKHLTFLFRNGDGAVAWAYPVTVARTPHRATFSTGEQVYAA